MAYTNIDDPSAYFQTKLYTGNGSTQSITNDGNSDMQPDWVWIKSRSNASWHNLFDSSRGATKLVFSNDTNAEVTRSTSLTSFNTDGFTLGADTVGTDVNGLNNTHVAWQWKANGGTTTSVSASGTGQASINASTHQVNQDAGFSIITYTGRNDQIANGEETKLTHGLGVAPDFTIMKKLNGTGGWIVMGKNVKETNQLPYSYNEHLILNTTAALNAVTFTGNAYPDSTYIYLGNALMNDAGDNYVCYAFAEKQGYSKFGSYVGNGNADGPFVYTGFKPAFIMIKRSDSTSSWQIKDSARNPNNLADKTVFANLANTEYSTLYFYDLLSNGFKARGTDSELNTSGGTYIYMAFAENPFTTSTGIPTTAR